MVDDIFGLNIQNDRSISTFHHFKINEFTPSQRNKIIKKWDSLRNHSADGSVNSTYLRIDNTTDVVNSTLGKMFGRGTMPAYPFFILSIISTYEANKPLDQEITSQGYCYQSLIYIYLRKEGVKNEEFDTYFNFLTELAHFFYREGRSEISEDELQEFLAYYTSNYNMPIDAKIILQKLSKTNIFSLDTCNNYSFCYSYLYYFFVGKYLAENLDKNKSIINTIIGNLHNDENAHIAVFISHHSKNNYLLDEIVLVAEILFEEYTPISLGIEEFKFLDEKADLLIQVLLPPVSNSPDKEREADLSEQDANEIIESNSEPKNSEDDVDSIIIKRSIRTVEVMGRILKNRAGSLRKDALERVFEAGMKVHLRLLSSFIEAVKIEEFQEALLEIIKGRINLIHKEKEQHPLSKEDEEKLLRVIFWNVIFNLIYTIIEKIIHSLGSSHLTNIVKTICEKENSPASFIVEHGILMWHKKNLQTSAIAEKIDSAGFSRTARTIINYLVVNYSRIHTIGYKEKQKIESRLGISSKLLLRENQKAEKPS